MIGHIVLIEFNRTKQSGGDQVVGGLLWILLRGGLSCRLKGGKARGCEAFLKTTVHYNVLLSERDYHNDLW